MEFANILAQAASHDPNIVIGGKTYFPITFLWEQIVSLSWLQAVLAVSFGIVYLMYGWRIFKILVVICFALAGMFVGINIGTRMGNPIWGGILGLFVLAAVSIPLMKWAVSILGAMAGGIIAGGIWYAIGLAPDYIMAGIAIGIIAGGMISFIVFKMAVMLFTSLGGSALVVTGLLALLHLYPRPESQLDTIRDLVFNHRWFVPVVMLLPTVAGLIIQNRFVKESPKWEL